MDRVVQTFFQEKVRGEAYRQSIIFLDRDFEMFIARKLECNLNYINIYNIKRVVEEEWNDN